MAVDASSKVQRDVVDGGDHGTDEGRPGEEERPAVVIGERDASRRRRRRLLPMRNLVVDCRDVKYHADRQRQRCTQPRRKIQTEIIL